MTDLGLLMLMLFAVAAGVDVVVATVLAGKLAAGICAIVFAKLLAVKKAEQLEREAGEDVLYDAERAVESVE